ncbi:MAG: hypothetical protein FD153_1346 [Rhodospirillaceae bacterium]|nr:MAG: hypothetical protein FD153_1346 [Rhodospirillaceae bacterium]
MTEQTQTTHPEVGKYCIIRTYSAGVHAGTVAQVSADWHQVTLNASRRIWRWEGAFTLSAVSQTGIDIETSRVAVVVPVIYLNDVIEIIPTTSQARATIEAAHG